MNHEPSLEEDIKRLMPRTLYYKFKRHGLNLNHYYRVVNGKVTGCFIPTNHGSPAHLSSKNINKWIIHCLDGDQGQFDRKRKEYKLISYNDFLLDIL